MTDDQIIDGILKDLVARKNSSPLTGYFVKQKFSLDWIKGQEIIGQMKSAGLIRVVRFDQIYPSTKGEKIQAHGGWLEHVKSETAVIEEQRRVDQMRLHKDYNQGRLAKWQVVVFWPLTIIAIIGGILGALSFFGINW